MHAVSLSCTNSRDAMRVVSSRLGVRFYPRHRSAAHSLL